MNARAAEGKLWSVVLAGGEGERIKPFIEQWLGRARPKQYCTFVGTRSLLQHTIDRADLVGDPDRRVTVMARGHAAEIPAQFGGRALGHVVLQPQNRDTAAGIFLPLTYVRAYDPSALVVIYPSDHFVHPEEVFAEETRRAVRAAEQLDRLVLLGVTPDGPEVEYGWIEPGRDVGWRLGYRVREVSAFVEKPTRAVATAVFSSGALWNTLVLAARIETLFELGLHFFPDVMALFGRLCDAIGTRNEARVLDEIYEVMPRRNFSSDLLQQAPERVAVIRLRGVTWSDWGRPERIAESLGRIGRQPAFPLEAVAAV